MDDRAPPPSYATLTSPDSFLPLPLPLPLPLSLPLPPPLSLSHSLTLSLRPGHASDSGAIQLANAELNGTDLVANNLTYANLYQSTSATGASGLLGLGFPINGEIWLEMLELEYNLTGRWLTPNESSAYYPIVPLLYAQGDISQQMFSLEVSRLGPDAIAADNSNPLDFNYTDNGGILTLGDYPEGMA